MNLLKYLVLPLAVFSLIGFEVFAGIGGTRLFLPLWWMAVACLFRDRTGSRESLWGAIQRTAITWLPLGLTWVFLFLPTTVEFYPLDKALLGSLCVFATAVWQARLWKGKGDWIPRPFWIVVAVAIIWLPYHILRPWMDIVKLRGTIDIAMFHSIAVNYVEGKGFWVSLFHSTNDFLGSHFPPILYILLLPYHFFSSPLYLIALQAFGLSAAGLVLFGLARQRTGDSTFAGVLALAFLLNPMVQGIQYAWFHMVAFAPAILFGVVWVWSAFYGEVAPEDQPSKRTLFWRGAALLSLVFLGLSLKEDVGAVLFFLGAAFAVTKPRHWSGWTLMAIAFLWVAFAMLWFIPSHREFGGYGFWDRILPKGEFEGSDQSTTELVWMGLVDRIFRLDKLKYIGYMGIPLAFLWIRSRQWILPGVPVFGWILLSTHWVEYGFYPCQYPSLPLATVFVASVGAASRLKGTRTLSAWTWAILVSTLGFHLLMANARIDHWVTPRVWKDELLVPLDATDLTHYLNKLPPDATVWAECCHTLVVDPQRHLGYRLIPPDEYPDDYPRPLPLYLVVNENLPGTPPWAKDLLNPETRSPHWSLVHENPFGSVFKWTPPNSETSSS